MIDTISVDSKRIFWNEITKVFHLCRPEDVNVFIFRFFCLKTTVTLAERNKKKLSMDFISYLF